MTQIVNDYLDAVTTLLWEAYGKMTNEEYLEFVEGVHGMTTKPQLPSSAEDSKSSEINETIE